MPNNYQIRDNGLTLMYWPVNDSTDELKSFTEWRDKNKVKTKSMRVEDRRIIFIKFVTKKGCKLCIDTWLKSHDEPMTQRKVSNREFDTKPELKAVEWPGGGLLKI
jgi:hypothetical protein